MSDGAAVTPLEEFFLGVVANELGSVPAGLPRRGEALAALRRVFSAPPTDEEKRLAAQDSGGDATGSRVSARIRSALKEALAAAHGPSGGSPPEAPNVIVIDRAHGGGEGRSVAQTLSVTLGASVASIVERGARSVSVPRTIVFAGESAVAELESVKSLDVGGRSVPFSISKKPGAGGAADANSIHVMPIPATLDLVEELSPESPSATASSSGVFVGKIVDGKYQVVRELGRGGFGSVVEARDRLLGARVAIKFLNPHVARSKESLTAFKAEAKRVTDLEHPNIVGWKTFGETADGTRYFVMEYLEGQDLEKAIKTDKILRPRRVARILLQCLDALRQAHKKSILHLDLKPRNVFLLPAEGGEDEQDTVKVIDFGIGQYMGGKDVVAAEAGSGTFVTPRKDDKAAIRRCTGCTPEYASPEQCGHMLPGDDIADLDGRSDLYSLGVMAFQMLTGELPFDAPPKENRRDWYRLHREVPAKKVRLVNSKVPRPLAAFVDRCLAKSPDDRFPNTDEAFEALDRWLNPSIFATAAKMAGVAIVPIAVAGVVYVRFFIEPPPFEVSRGGNKIDSLVLGSESPSATLEIGDLDVDPSAWTPQLRWLDDRSEVSNVVESWDASAADGLPRVALSVSEGAANLVGRSAYLSLERGLAKGRTSQSFFFSYLGGDFWSIESLDVGARSGKAIDPVGGEARVRIRSLSRSAIQSVSLKSGEWNVPASLETETPGDPPTLVYRENLDRLRGGASTTITATVRDAAGREAAAYEQVDLEPEALEIREYRVAGSAERAADRISVFSGKDSSLVIELSGRADVSFRVTKSGGEISAGAAARTKDVPGGVEFQVPLAFLDGQPEGTIGTIEITCDDSAYVSRTERARGLCREKPSFVISREIRPRVEIFQDAERIDPVITSLGPGVPEAAVSFVASREIAVRVRLEAVAKVWIVASVREPGESAAKTLATRLMRNVSMDPIAITLGKPGLHEIDVAFFPYFEEGDTPDGPGEGRAPQKTETRRVVLDESPATIVVRPVAATGRGASEPVVLSSAADTFGLAIDVADSPADGSAVAPPANPVDLVWRLARIERLGERKIETALPAPQSIAGVERAEPGRTIELSVYPAGPGDAIARDGTYVLRYQGMDMTGREAAGGEVSWIVSTSGPGIEILSPRDGPDAKWPDPWDVRVVVKDPNGVGSVTCRVERVNAEGASVGQPVPVPLDLDGETVWTGSADLNGYEWAGSTARIVVEAADDCSRKSEGSLTIAVGEGQGHYPRRIRAWVGDVDLGYLRLVDGNKNENYVWGGMNDEFEIQQWSRLGLWDTFKDRSVKVQKSWGIEYGKSEIRPYYLGECEVSRDQFLAFLARSGASSGIEADRASALARTLREASGTLPASSVRWGEADAFARWAGLRLPTPVEWEFAVRGGTAYRMFSCQTDWEPQDLTQLAQRIVISSAGLLRREPLPVGTSGDVTPETGLRDLCGNVSEWTASPAFEKKVHPDRKLALLRPGDLTFDTSSLKAMWVGANYGSIQRVDFNYVYSDVRDKSDPMIGFRLAVDRDVAGTALQSGTVAGSAARFEVAPGETSGLAKPKK